MQDLKTTFFDVGSYDSSGSVDSENSSGAGDRLVIITSWTLNVSDLRRYIATLCNFKKNASELRMYIATKKSNKKHCHAELPLVKECCGSKASNPEHDTHEQNGTSKAHLRFAPLKAPGTCKARLGSNRSTTT